MTRPSNPDREHAHGQGSFFGRRKGHKLRSHQADLIDNLLPRLALDIGSPDAGNSRGYFRSAARGCQARNRFRRRRASDRGGAGLSQHRLHRLRALCQRHGKDPDPDRGAQYRQCQTVRGRCRRTVGLGAGAFVVADRPDPSRSLAKTAALEAALCAGRNRRGDGAGAQGRRRIPLRLRYRRLRRVDARASVALARFCVARRARRRLAPAVGRLHHDALRPEGRTRGTRGGVFAVSNGPHPEERREACRSSKDGHGLSWFETAQVAPPRP